MIRKGLRAKYVILSKIREALDLTYKYSCNPSLEGVGSLNTIISLISFQGFLPLSLSTFFLSLDLVVIML